MAKNTGNHTFPWSHVIGFIFSIALTFLAVGVALYTDLALNTIIIIIFAFAFLQAAVQLFMFMHIKEGDGAWQITKMASAGFIAIVIVYGSYWVMTNMH
ncbi:cytochrome aa3 quinol oxidase subunit IV [Bacillus sp. FJAT-47783]|uniref:cytochrome aa3 quinol oxidase subunit IV n=1 Tax=Bacillus sp. FJAT-47783 TaxID=2922712 RepID=UPI001FACE42A|nr:cytochrome aa3 quinol oxidase subunit IV [Bacillus sp. FJAT-47783]